MTSTISAAQEHLTRSGLDGWLLRDYFGANPIFWAVVGASPGNMTRPCFLFIPPVGRPAILAHEVDAGRFAELFPGDASRIDVQTFASRTDMVRGLRRLLPAGGRVAMEYSPAAALPRVGRVDAGTVELVRSLGVEVVGSGDVLQYATERWSPRQLESHRFAARSLTRIVNEAFAFVAENINWKLTEYDLAEFIRGRYDRLGLTADDGPVVAVDAHSSDPHYAPAPSSAAVIRRGSWLLLDIWARKAGDPRAVYADITWTAHLGRNPGAERRSAFEAVTRARDAAVRYIREECGAGRTPEGWQVDRAARKVIEDAGFGDRFVHRLGHSLGLSVHSNAVNLDDWETHDTRKLIPRLGVTVEPGVYLGEFGVRSEIDLYITPDGPEVTTTPQEDIVLIDV